MNGREDEMLRILLMLLLLVLPVSACRAGVPGVSLQEIDVTLLPSEGSLKGTSVFHAAEGSSFSVTLSPALEVESVSFAGSSVGYTRKGEVVTLDSRTKGGPVTVRFSGRFANRFPSGLGFGEDPTYGVSAVISAEGTFLGGEAGWYPEPEMQPTLRRLTIRAPAGTAAITAGRLVAQREEQGQTVTVWETVRPLRHLSLSAGRYIATSRNVGDIALSTWFLPQNTGLAPSYLDASEKYLRLYTELLGPYPFEKFAVVENFLPTGYGFPSYTLIGGSVLRLPFIVSTSLPHEIVHSWWGNGVHADYGRGNWSEGLTAYLADYLLEERKSPEAGRTHRLKLLTDYATLVSPENDFPLSAFLSRTDPASRAIGYGKGAMAFHMVRMEIGDDLFFGALRRIVREKMFRTASWNDFAKAFAAGGNSAAERLFLAFVEMKGGLQVRAEQVRLRKTGDGWEVTGLLRQTPLKEKVRVKLAAERGNVRTDAAVRVGSDPVPFRFVTKEKPERLLLDPDADLFRELSPEEIPFTVNRIKGSRKVVGVISRSCRAEEKTFRLLLESLGHPNAGVFREGALKPGKLEGADVLVCGIPGSDLLPDLPGAKVGERSFTLESRSFSSDGDLLFAVGPRRGGGAAAVFLPLSAQAAEAAAAKITHYGTYGYLAFSTGKNIVKGTAPRAGGPAVVPLREEP